MNVDEMRDLFVVETRELLAGMESSLLAIDLAAVDPENVHAIFRAAHTIKGSAGLFPFAPIVEFTHVVESVLDGVRGGRLALDETLVALLLSCVDHVAALTRAVEAGTLDEDPVVQAGSPLVDELEAYLGAGKAVKKTAIELTSPKANRGADELAGESVAVSSDNWHISLRCGRELLRNGMDPLSLLRYLGTLGTIVGIETIPDALPPLHEADPESCYLGFEIAFQSDASKKSIEDVFEFVRDSSAIRILPPRSKISEYVRLIEELPEEPARIGEILLRAGSVTQHELDAALSSQDAAKGTPEPLGEILVSRGSIHPEVVEAAAAKQRHVREVKAQEGRSVRVDADKLDQLINLVGELIIAAASSEMIARRAHATELMECTARLSGLVSEVRDSALELRMVKIGATFKRFQRVVHDVSREIGKDIGLVVEGEDTELDKTVVEQLGDPLLHLVRNAVDHGIEPPEVRAARGKPAKGTVRLNAYHDSGNIVIEVSDDGGGLKRDKILAKAIERGIVEAGRTLSDDDVNGLIFEPGFSTAEQVTNLSGRGVGMDVVKRNIVALRGSIAVKSEEGVGTTVVVRLPLTLAIIDGFLVGLGKSVFVVPLDVIEECVELSADPGHDYMSLRGQVLPFIRLREIFSTGAAAPQRENVVIIKHGGHKAGLVVDTLLGEFQTVIKPLGRLFGQVACISGSSILGTGEVALILDVPTLMTRAERPAPNRTPLALSA